MIPTLDPQTSERWKNYREYAPARKGHWMQTATGRAYWPLDPRPEEIFIEDVAAGLSRECRFGGQLREDVDHYSVAEHSVLGSYLVPQEHAFEFLMHDSPEGLIKDLLRPIKVDMPDYQRIERLNWAAFSVRFRLPLELPQCVKDADIAMLFAEREAVMAPLLDATLERSWGMGLVTPLWFDPYKIECWTPRCARRRFLERFHELYQEKKDG